MARLPVVCFLIFGCLFRESFAAASARTFHVSAPLFAMRGGAASKTKQNQDSYRLLALAIQNRLPGDEEVDVDKLTKTLSSLSSAQKALKGLDGVAHEAYARTHDEESLDTKVSGRARRSAARAGCAADGLLAAELCELLERPDLLESNSETGTLAGREILVNATFVKMTKDSNVTVLVLYEPQYNSGAGMDHGGIEDLAGSSVSSNTRGRLLVIVGDSLAMDLPKTCAVLDTVPVEVELHAGLVANEIASVQGTLYRTAGRLLRELEPTLREVQRNSSAFRW